MDIRKSDPFLYEELFAKGGSNVVELVMRYE